MPEDEQTWEDDVILDSPPGCAFQITDSLQMHFPSWT